MNVVICPDCMGFGYFELAASDATDPEAAYVECESCAGLGYIPESKGENTDADDDQ